MTQRAYHELPQVQGFRADPSIVSGSDSISILPLQRGCSAIRKDFKNHPGLDPSTCRLDKGWEGHGEIARPPNQNILLLQAYRAMLHIWQHPQSQVYSPRNYSGGTREIAE